jgi:MFS family permease|nr:MFS transporter [Kofleriaceae bacterium]
MTTAHDGGTPTEPPRPKHPPAWLFGIVGIPYGVGGVFVASIMPSFADDAHINIGEIGWFTTLLFVPPMIQFLYAPIVDIGPKRKHWLVLLSIIGALFFALSFSMRLPDHKLGFLVCAFLGQMITGLTGSCNGGLLAMTMPDEKRGSASAWLNIGNLSGGALAAWLILYMHDSGVAPLWIALVFAAMIVTPSLAILTVVEDKREPRKANVVFGDMLSSVKAVLFSKAGITGILLCLSPVGTAALTNFFAGMKHSFHGTNDTRQFISGPGSAVFTAVGAWICGWLCDQYNRRALYLLSGVMTAIVGIGLALAPHDDTTYLYGSCVYLFVTGFCYSSFTATVLETIGNAGKAASTQYALFVAAGNVAIAYTGFLDTRFGGGTDSQPMAWWPTFQGNVSQIVGSDGVLNFVGVIVLGLVFWRLGSFGKSKHQPSEA